MLIIKGLIRRTIENESDNLLKNRDSELQKVLNHKNYKASIADNIGFYNLNIFVNNSCVAIINSKDPKILMSYCEVNDMVCRNLSTAKI